MQIGIIKEGKTPPDSRVPLTPTQCAELQNKGLDICVASSPIRCYTNAEYEAAGIPFQENLEDRELLLGVKEVPIDQLIPGKTYCFFSHTIKAQPYNRKLLQAILEKKIHLVDYEVLTNEKGQRLIAFGWFAGMVGAHNGMLTYGKRTGTFELTRMKDCYDYEEAKKHYRKLQWPPIKIVLTGTGRVGSGAAEVLRDMGIQQVEPKDFLNFRYNQPVFTQLDCEHYASRKDGTDFNLQDFYQHPHLYKSTFEPYSKVSDLMINGIYWDNAAPAFFSKDDMKSEDFNIKVIADVTCDIAPVASIPSTLRATTIAEPFMGYDPNTGQETAPFQPHSIDMMTIDNLPNELPRDASKAFGEQFIEHILPEFLQENSTVIERATIAKDGQLGPHFQYLQSYVDGK